jgi:class 3 adenylate cyclase
MAVAPVTLLFTDLENSTEFLARAPDERAQLMQTHHRLLNDSMTAHGGREMRWWLGNSLLAVFDSAADAVRAAVAMQQAAHRRTAGERLALRVG